MATFSRAVQTAADALQTLSDANPGERGRRASVVALVLRAVDRASGGEAVCGFWVRRAEQEVERLPAGAERALLRRLLLLAEASGAGEGRAPLADALVEYACALEEGRRLPEADAVVSLAWAIAPVDPRVALHAGRIARKAADRERALVLYRTARALDGEGGSLTRLAAIGEAVVSAEPERALSRRLREAVRAQDAEAAAVALEERARVRRGAGDRRGAARDLCFAAVRFSDPVDRARVAHRLADLCVADGDAPAAREALLLALAVGDASQKDHARSRLHAVSRDLGDEVGMRRWRSFNRPVLVSLSARPRRTASSMAPRLGRWRERVLAALPEG